MSLPKEKLVELVRNLNESDVEKVLNFVEHITNKQTQPDKKLDISQFIGIYKDLDIDVDEEAKKLRDEWEKTF